MAWQVGAGRFERGRGGMGSRQGTAGAGMAWQVGRDGIGLGRRGLVSRRGGWRPEPLRQTRACLGLALAT